MLNKDFREFVELLNAQGVESRSPNLPGLEALDDPSDDADS
jgi:hypothetical protein